MRTQHVDVAVTSGARVGAPPGWALAVAIAAIAAAEACVVYVSVDIGIVLHAVIVLVLLNAYVIGTGSREEAPPLATAGWDVLICLALVPLLRVLSATMAVRDVAELHQYVLIGTPMLLAVVMAARSVGVRRFQGWFQRSGTQVGIALSGIPLGILAYLIARPEPLPDARAWGTVVLGPLILLIFSALGEELVFRGLIQHTLVDLVGRPGIGLGGVVYAIACLGVRPLGYWIFIVAVGLAFGVLVERTHSLVGVIFAHGLLIIGAILVWPVVFG